MVLSLIKLACLCQQVINYAERVSSERRHLKCNRKLAFGKCYSCRMCWPYCSISGQKQETELIGDVAKNRQRRAVSREVSCPFPPSTTSFYRALKIPREYPELTYFY